MKNIATPDSRLQGFSHEQLEDCFGCKFEFWENEAGWKPVDSNLPNACLRSIDQPELIRLLDRAFEPAGTVVLAVAKETNLVIIPAVPEKSPRLAAVGTVSGPTALIERLAASTFQCFGLQDQIDDLRLRLDVFAEQVSCDFEEIRWMRGLAEQIEHSDLSTGFETIAEAVLPPLVDLIKAESIVLFLDDRPDAPKSARTFAVGEPFDLSLCFGIVARFAGQALKRPFVGNNLERLSDFAGTGARSCILVPIAKKGHKTGWLLALNRRPNSNSLNAYSSFFAPAQLEQDFGTFEAGLLSATAVLLATHEFNAHLFHKKESLLIGVVRALINGIDAKDSYTCGHSDRVALIAKRLAQELGESEQYCEQIYMTGLLHDVGKIGVPDQILQKPGELTEEEFERIKKHPVIGHSILKHLEELGYVLPGVLHHHESVDGSGYPSRLAGSDIPLSARILAVSDAYDAMTSSRPYRNAMPPERAESILRENAGVQWDRAVVDAFFRAVDDIRELSQQAAEQQKEIEPLIGDESGYGSHDAITSAVVATRQ